MDACVLVEAATFCGITAGTLNSGPPEKLIGAAGPEEFQSLTDSAHPAGWMQCVKTGRCETSMNR